MATGPQDQLSRASVEAGADLVNNLAELPLPLTFTLTLIRTLTLTLTR